MIVLEKMKLFNQKNFKLQQREYSDDEVEMKSTQIVRLGTDASTSRVGG
jgi:hypothetical protein